MNDLDLIIFCKKDSGIISRENSDFIVLDHYRLARDSKGFDELLDRNIGANFYFFAIENDIHELSILENGFIPVFPDCFVALGLEKFGNAGGRAVVIDGKLLSSFLARLFV